MAQIYIKEVFLKYRVLDKIISDRDIRFISVTGRRQWLQNVCVKGVYKTCAIDRKGQGRKEIIYLRVANVSYTRGVRESTGLSYGGAYSGVP